MLRKPFPTFKKESNGCLDLLIFHATGKMTANLKLDHPAHAEDLSARHKHVILI